MLTINAGNQIVQNLSIDYIIKAKIEIFIVSFGKGRILAASACPSQKEGRASEGKDPSLLTSALVG